MSLNVTGSSSITSFLVWANKVSLRAILQGLNSWHYASLIEFGQYRHHP